MQQSGKGWKKNLTIDLKKDVGGNNLVIALASAQKTVHHQIEVINHNAPPGIILVEERKDNKQTKLYYCINNLTPLSYYIEKEEISSAEVIRILDEVVETILESKNYLLSAAGFLLQQEYIYLDFASRKVSLVYLPVRLQSDINESFRNLLKELSYTYDDFPQELRAYSQEEFFNLRGFREQIKSIIFSHHNRLNPEKEQGIKKTFQLQAVSDDTQIKKEVSVGEELPLEVFEDRAADTIKVAEAFYLKRSVLIFIAVQLGIAVVLVLFSSVIKALGGIATYLGLLLIIMSFDYLLLKKLLRKE